MPLRTLSRQPPLDRIVPCAPPLGVRFVERDVLGTLLSRQGPRDSGRGGQISSAYYDRYGQGDPHFGIIGAFWGERLLGVSSFGVIENRHIHVHDVEVPRDRFWYGRIDAVVVEPACRGHGVGGWLVNINLRYFLAGWPGKLYSISTIAAHKAIAHILGSLGFEVTEDLVKEEDKVSLRIDEGQEEELAHLLAGRVSENARRVFFRLRQEENQTSS